MHDIISSPANTKIKNLVKLIEKSAERKEQNLIVIEGKREIDLAIQSGFEIETIFVCTDIAGELSYPNQQIITRAVFEKIAYRENSDGLIALAKPKHLSLAEIKLNANPLLIILEAVEKPGNLGAILRTADAADADAVIICDSKTDLYNPNTIRASIGCIFTKQVIAANTDEVLNWLKGKNITPYSAALTATKNYTETNLDKPCAIVMGTEADGLSEKWLTNAEQIKIPMLGKIDSLNVSTSCAIIVFEAVRKRNLTH
jgi:TrmH family RNA methyltransferase